MNAITVIQPWATLLAVEAKRFETRSWPAPPKAIGSLLAIHAGKNVDEIVWLKHQIETMRSWDDDRTQNYYRRGPRGQYLGHLRNVFAGTQYRFVDFPLGRIVAIGRLLRSHRTDALEHLSARERAFGDFSAGRFAWEIEVVRFLADPIQATGKQGVWQWDPPAGLLDGLDAAS